MKNLLCALLFAFGLLLAGSDGDLFPWPNFLGLLFLVLLLIVVHAPGSEARRNIGRASSFHPAAPDGISSGSTWACEQGPRRSSCEEIPYPEEVREKYIACLLRKTMGHF
jgi:hypothetical protein